MKGAQKVQSKFCAQSETWAYTKDVLGNRLTKAPAGLSAAASIYSWDILNRMTSYRSSGSQNVNTYKYRADGMRVKKTVPGSTIKSTFYRYDGQMSIEEYSVGSNHLVNGITRNTLGARGIDMIQRATATVNETSYPLYDAHGNMTAQLLKNGASFTVANEKSYDAWGAVRQGNSNPEYKGRYCANLGHVQDDESGLIYMRARYYEPSSGRFVSQDTAMDGENWFAYCENQPINKSDRTGKSAESFFAGLMLFIVGYIMFVGADEFLPKMADKLAEGVISSILRIKGLSPEKIMEFENDLQKKIAFNKAMKTGYARNGMKAAGGALMAGGVCKALTAITGYSFLCQALLIDSDNTDGPDILCTLML